MMEDPTAPPQNLKTEPTRVQADTLPLRVSHTQACDYLLPPSRGAPAWRLVLPLPPFAGHRHTRIPLENQ
jgi:hypothetical protein